MRNGCVQLCLVRDGKGPIQHFGSTPKRTEDALRLVVLDIAPALVLLEIPFSKHKQDCSIRDWMTSQLAPIQLSPGEVGNLFSSSDRRSDEGWRVYLLAVVLLLHSAHVQLLATPRVEVFLSGNMSLQRELHGAAPLCIKVATVFDRTISYL